MFAYIQICQLQKTITKQIVTIVYSRIIDLTRTSITRRLKSSEKSGPT